MGGVDLAESLGGFAGFLASLLGLVEFLTAFLEADRFLRVGVAGGFLLPVGAGLIGFAGAAAVALVLEVVITDFLAGALIDGLVDLSAQFDQDLFWGGGGWAEDHADLVGSAEWPHWGSLKSVVGLGVHASFNLQFNSQEFLAVAAVVLKKQF